MSPTDQTLIQQVSHALENSPYLRRRQLRTHAADGRVTLEGEVRTYYHKQMAQEVVRRVDGVLGVDNLLEVHG